MPGRILDPPHRRYAPARCDHERGYRRVTVGIWAWDEEGTHSRLARYRRDIIEPTVAEHNGGEIPRCGTGRDAIRRLCIG
jgi:hypothetical protein